MAITANELVALYNERIGTGTICDFLAEVTEKTADCFRYDPDLDRIMQIGDVSVLANENELANEDRGLDEGEARRPREAELSAEMLDALRMLIEQSSAT